MITDPIVAIDPGKTCTGVAYLHGPHAWATTIRGTTALDVDQVFRLLTGPTFSTILLAAKARKSNAVTADESDALMMARWAQLYGQRRAADAGKPILVIEMQHLKQHGAKGKPKKISFKSLVTLIESRCFWTTLALPYGFALAEVGASTWQGPMLGTVPRLDENGEVRSTKDRSKEVTATVWRSVPRMTLIDRRAKPCQRSI